MIIKEEILVTGKELRSHKNVTIEVCEAIKKAKIIIPPFKNGNGVKPIKHDVMEFLVKKGWTQERPMDLEGMRAKPLDAYKEFKSLRVGLEWETGNISSTFRALMKLYKGLIEDKIDYGILALPSHEFYYYLTDRVGNIRELRPYLSVYQKIQVENQKSLKIIVIEHDSISENARPIPKGTDGRAKV